MLSRRVKVIVAFLFGFVLVGTFALYRKNAAKGTSDSSTLIPSVKKTDLKYSILKSLATEPVELKQVIPVSNSNSPEFSDTFAIPSNIPISCQNLGVMKSILETAIDKLFEKIQTSESGLQSCLLELGGPAKCFSVRAGDDEEDRGCTNNLIIARSRLIDAIYAKDAVKSLDKAVVANKIIAKIYNKDGSSPDEKGTEIFLLADKMVEFESEDSEAHNLRSYFSVQAIKLKFDESILSKGKESATFLVGSSNEKDFKLGLFYQFSYNPTLFIRPKSSHDLGLNV